MITPGEFLKWLAIFGIKPGGGGGGGVSAVQVQQNTFNTSADSGTDGTAYVGALTPAVTSYTEYLTVWMKPANSNSIINPTLALNGLAPKFIRDQNGFTLDIGAIVSNIDMFLVFNTTTDTWILTNPIVYAQPLANNNILIGNVSGVAQAQTVDGDATIDNTGALTVSKIGGKSVVLGGAFSLVGAHTFTGNLTADTNITFPTTGTLATTSNLSSYLPLAGGTMTGNLNLNADATTAFQAVTYQQLQAVASGITVVAEVLVATTANLTTTYDNGTAGVGATLTFNSVGAIVVDGVSLVLNDQVLVKNQTAPEENGWYFVSVEGDGGTQGVLTRNASYDQPSDIAPGDLFLIDSGPTNGGSSWLQTQTVTTIGTDPLSFFIWTASPSSFLIAGNNLSDVQSATTSRTNLGLEIGTDVQAWNSQLDDISNNVWIGSPSITTLGTIIAGTWNGDIVTPDFGGTGVDNGSSTITIGGNVVFNGLFPATFNFSASTNVNFPTSGTLVTTGGTIANANNVNITNDVTTNAAMFPLWVTANSGFLPVKVSSTKFSFNPSSGNLTIAGSLISPSVKGSNNHLVVTFADSASSVNYFGFGASITGAPTTFDATGADASVIMNLRTKAGDFWLSDFTGTRAPSLLWFDAAGTNAVGFRAPSTLSGNQTWVLPGADGTPGQVIGTDGAGNLVFLASGSSSDVTVTNDTTTNASVYPTWVTANSGSLPVKVSSTKFSFNPSTGNLTIAGSVITPSIKDTNGNIVIAFGSHTSAVNYLQFDNEATGNGTSIRAVGTDAAIGINLYVKNSGIVLRDSTNTTAPLLTFTNAAGTHFTGLKADDLQSTDVVFVLPTADGAPGDVITTDGFGNLSLQAAGGVAPVNIQYQSYTAGVDIGVADAYAVNYSPPTTVFSGELALSFTASNDNTGVSTIDVDGRGAVEIVDANGNSLVGGEIKANFSYDIQGNSVLNKYVLKNPSGASGGGVTDAQVQSAEFIYGVDTGVADAYVVAYTPAVTVMTLTDGMILSFRPSNTNTGDSTIDVGNGTPFRIVYQDDNIGVGTPLVAGALWNFSTYIIQYSIAYGCWILINPSALPGGFVTRTELQYQDFVYCGNDTGVVDAYVIDNAGSPIVSYLNGLKLSFRPTNTNTGGSVTLNAGTGSATALTMYDGSTPPPGALLATSYYEVAFDGDIAGWILLNPSTTYSKQVYGTQTNDNAPAGFIGEYYESVVLAGAGVPLTTVTATDVTSVSIPSGGDWEVGGNINFRGDAGTVVNVLSGWGDTASATPVNGAYATNQFFSSLTLGTNDTGFVIPTRRFSEAAGATVYLSCLADFSVNSLEASGALWIRRVR